MASDTLTGMTQGFPVPNHHLEHTAHDTNVLPPGTCSVTVAASAAASIVMSMTDEPSGETDCEYHLPVAGVYTFYGSFSKVKATGTDVANLVPANTVIVGYLS